MGGSHDGGAVDAQFIDGRGITMQENKERWMELCAQAAVEQDPKKLMTLVKEIGDLLENKATPQDSPAKLRNL